MVKEEESGEVVVDEGGDGVLEEAEREVVEAKPPQPPQQVKPHPIAPKGGP